jgi:hexosaminidase
VSRNRALPVLALVLVAVAVTARATAGSHGGSPYRELIPKPVRAEPRSGEFVLEPVTRIVVSPGSAELRRTGAYLAERLGKAVGGELTVVAARGGHRDRAIHLAASDASAALGSEGYELRVRRDGIEIAAGRPEGVFRGVQTLLQLLPGGGGRSLPAGTVVDRPRFEWRGFMLDVARHFFAVEDVKRLIDVAALYKLNRLHLHLSDDQGWRLDIRSWPRLARHGGRTAVGGGRGGFYTQAQYAEIVRYAASRYVVVVPEIDMPGHTNAALASYPELSCDGKPRALYTGIEVGFSSLCIGNAVTDRFIADVLREVAALTPGPYLHVGGDEASSTQPDDYVAFVGQAEQVVRSLGKRLVGWGEIGAAPLSSTSIAQHWHGGRAQQAVGRGAKVVMSPAEKTYLDMKYDRSTALGLSWAGFTSVRDAYDWDPATTLPGVAERDVLGVEAPLWSETLESIADVEYMALPRLLGHAEIGWSPRRGRSWDDYRRRLAAHGRRLEALGVGYYRAPGIPWR